MCNRSRFLLRFTPIPEGAHPPAATGSVSSSLSTKTLPPAGQDALISTTGTPPSRYLPAPNPSTTTAALYDGGGASPTQARSNAATPVGNSSSGSISERPSPSQGINFRQNSQFNPDVRPFGAAGVTAPVGHPISLQRSSSEGYTPALGVRSDSPSDRSTTSTGFYSPVSFPDSPHQDNRYLHNPYRYTASNSDMDDPPAVHGFSAHRTARPSGISYSRSHSGYRAVSDPPPSRAREVGRLAWVENLTTGDSEDPVAFTNSGPRGGGVMANRSTSGSSTDHHYSFGHQPSLLPSTLPPALPPPPPAAAAASHHDGLQGGWMSFSTQSSGGGAMQLEGDVHRPDDVVPPFRGGAHPVQGHQGFGLGNRAGQRFIYPRIDRRNQHLVRRNPIDLISLIVSFSSDSWMCLVADPNLSPNVCCNFRVGLLVLLLTL
jgi:hypothetical protein